MIGSRAPSDAPRARDAAGQSPADAVTVFEIERSTQLYAIRELHRAHEVRTADARLVRHARVAIADRSVRRSDVVALLERCGGEVVRTAEDATIVVEAPDTAHGRRRTKSRQRVVDEAGLRAMVDAYEAVYTPPSLHEAARRARARLASDLVSEAITREQRRQETVSKRTRKGVVTGAVTEDELRLEATVRGLRAKGSAGSFVRR
jgi:hypothetical protein